MAPEFWTGLGTGLGLIAPILTAVALYLRRPLTKVASVNPMHSDLKDIKVALTRLEAKLDDHIQWHLGPAGGRG